MVEPEIRLKEVRGSKKRKAAAEVDFFEFTREAWPVVVPGEPFMPNWHVEAICDHLQALQEDKFDNLLINIPPRHGKSILCCVMYPAWLWLVDPAYRMIYASYSQTFAMRDSRETHRLILSPWYQGNWGSNFAMAEDAEAQVRFENTKKGFRIATSPGGLGTGEGGDLIAVDDPHKADEVASEVQRQAVLDWWNVTMQTRTGRFGRTKRLVVMQRLHEKDLSGDIIERGGYTHLCLPQEYEPNHPNIRKFWPGWSGDPRKLDGDLLWPDRFPRERIDVEQKPPRLSSTVYAGQYQQRPAPAEGSFFLRKWWKFHKQDPLDLIQKAKFKCWSWDMAFKDLDDSDFVCGLAWCAVGPDFYLLPQRYHARMGFSASKIAVKSGKAKYPGIHAILVEDKANGTAVVEDLKKTMSGLIAVEPEGGKESRAAVVQPYAEGGSIYLPDPSIAPWIGEYIDEMATFPNAENDDYVDATSQAIVWLLNKMGRSFHLTWSSNKSFTGRSGETYRDPRFGDEGEFIPSERGDGPKKKPPVKPAMMRVVP